LGYDAIILAYAGIHRMEWQNRISEVLPTREEQCGQVFEGDIKYGSKLCYHAVGQGAIAIECRKDDLKTKNLLKRINDISTFLTVTAERGFMHELEGGCSVPLGVSCLWITNDVMSLDGTICSVDGSKFMKASLQQKVLKEEDAFRLGQSVAVSLKEQGAEDILAGIKNVQ
jgi:hydroxymethylbilane synthase